MLYARLTDLLIQIQNAVISQMEVLSDRKALYLDRLACIPWPPTKLRKLLANLLLVNVLARYSKFLFDYPQRKEQHATIFHTLKFVLFALHNSLPRKFTQDNEEDQRFLCKISVNQVALWGALRMPHSGMSLIQKVCRTSR